MSHRVVHSWDEHRFHRIISDAIQMPTGAHDGYVITSDPNGNFSWMPGGGTGVAVVFIGPDPPPSPVQGELWWRNDPDGNLYIFYTDVDSSQWVPATATEGGAPGGPAGGDLTGTYPNPTIALGVVTIPKLAPDVLAGLLPPPNIPADAGKYVTPDTAGHISWQPLPWKVVAGALVGVTPSVAQQVLLPGTAVSGTGLDDAQIVFGQRTERGRLMASPVQDWFGMSLNGIYDGLSWRQDDGLKPTWVLALDGGNDTFRLQRAPGGSGALANLLAVKTTGATFGVPVTLPADPTVALGAATKQYVDNKVITLPPHSVDRPDIFPGATVYNIAQSGRPAAIQVSSGSQATNYMFQVIPARDVSPATVRAVRCSGNVQGTAWPAPGLVSVHVKIRDSASGGTQDIARATGGGGGLQPWSVPWEIWFYAPNNANFAVAVDVSMDASTPSTFTTVDYGNLVLEEPS